MIQTGLFYPSGKWLVPFQGSGMDVGRAAAAWDMLTAPPCCSMQDVHKVFFSRNPFNHSTPRYFEVDPIDESGVDTQRKRDDKWVSLEQLSLITEPSDCGCSSVDATAADALVAIGLQVYGSGEPSAPPNDKRLPPRRRPNVFDLVAPCRQGRQALPMTTPQPLEPLLHFLPMNAGSDDANNEEVHPCKCFSLLFAPSLECCAPQFMLCTAVLFNGVAGACARTHLV